MVELRRRSDIERMVELVQVGLFGLEEGDQTLSAKSTHLQVEMRQRL